MSTPDFVPLGKMRRAKGARSKPTPESKALLWLFPLIWRKAGKKRSDLRAQLKLERDFSCCDVRELFVLLRGCKIGKK